MRAVLKSYRKNILREMKDNLSRMVSLFGIVALGGLSDALAWLYKEIERK